MRFQEFATFLKKTRRSPQPQSHANGLMKIHAHAVEILPSNVLVLQDMFRRMRIPGTVHALAFSNYTGSAYRSRFFRTGQEDSGVRASAEVAGGSFD